MARSDNLHSTLVAWLKVVLPLTALAILSLLFLVARTVEPGGAPPAGGGAPPGEPRIAEATWAGVTEDGAAVMVRVAEARPGPGGGGATAEAVHARMDLPGGATVDLVADSGAVDPAGRTLALRGNVVVTTSTGYRIETAAMEARLDRSGLEARQTIVASGPFGRLTGGSMTMTADAAGGHLVVFKGGVRLLYDPAAPPAETAAPAPPAPVPPVPRGP